MIRFKQNRVHNSSKICASVFNCAMSQVRLKKLPIEMKHIGEDLLKMSASDLPKVATIRNLIMLIQAVYSILNTNRVNLARHASFLKGHHINDVHVWTTVGLCFRCETH